METDINLPALFNAADYASVKSQKYYSWLYLFNLVIIVLITVGGSISLLIDQKHIKNLYVLIGVLYTLSLFFTILIKFNKWENKWYNGRAIAESIKSISWKYMLGSEPFNVSIEDSLVDNRFLDVMKNILNEIKGNNILNGGVFGSAGQITDKMREIRKLATIERRDYYINNRIKEQRNWYSKKAKLNYYCANIYFTALIICQIIAIMFSFYMVLNPDFLIKYTSILATIATSILAWLQLKKHQELSQSYSIAEQDLGLIQDKSIHIRNDGQLSVYVADAETAISREHILWLARRDVFNYVN